MALHTVEAILSSGGRLWKGLVDVPTGTTNLDAYCRQTLSLMSLSNQLDIQPCKLGRNEFFPRMARPYHIHNSYVGGTKHGPLYRNDENMASTLPHDKAALGNSLGQMAILVESLRKIFQFIHPAPNNLSSYGHQSRNLLLLACMDFENECKGLLNAYQYGQQRTDTRDYVKVCAPLRLVEYEVRLRHYPLLPAFAPFVGWNASAATLSIPWYDSYNAVKHDREVNFCKATIEAAANAVCAVAIMLAAQYRVIHNWEDQIGHFFLFEKYPSWKIEEYYIPPAKWSGWTPLAYTF